MFDALGFVAGHGVQSDCVDAAENAVFDIGVVTLETAEQDLDLLPLGAASTVVAHGAVLGEAAGTLDKFEVVVPLPCEDILFLDAVHRADEGHAGEAGAVEHGRHRLQLRAIEHAHDSRLDDIVEVVTQRDFVAAQFLGLAVQMAAAHPGAEIAGVLVGVIGDREDITLEDRHGNVQKFRVRLDLLAVDLIIARVHHKEDQLKRHIAVFLQLLHQFCHQHGILAARDTDGDFIAGLDQLIAFHRYDEGRPKLLAVFLDDAAFDHLVRFQFTFHFKSSLLADRLSRRSVHGNRRRTPS